MRILYIVGQGEGGLAHYTAELANAMAADHEVIVLKPSETDADDLFATDVELVDAFDPIEISMPRIYSLDIDPLAAIRGLHSYTRIRKAFDIDPDVIHDPTGLFPQVQMYASYHDIDDAFPFVVTKHEVPKNRFSLSRPPVLVEEAIKAGLADLNTDRTIVHTSAQREAIEKHGTDPSELCVIPHGTYSVFGSYENIDRDPEPNTLLFFGNIVPPKGPDVLIEAMPLVRDQIPEATLIIAGDGALPDGARSLINDHPDAFEEHNRFIPNEEVREFFGRAELIAAPYRSQDGTKGHSGVVSTAFAFGKPIVATTIGDFERLVGESGCGKVVPPDDPERLAAAIVDILSEEQMRARMASRSQEMGNRLSWDNVASDYADLYEAVCSVGVDQSGTAGKLQR